MSTGTLAPRRDTTFVSTVETVVSGAQDSIHVDVSAERLLTDTDQLSATLRRLATDLGLAPAGHRDSEERRTAGGAVGDALAGPLLLAGNTQPVSVGTNRQTWVEIAPGVIVRAERREERFASVELGAFQKRMPPEVFAAFVKHIGVVSGREDLDIVKLTQPPDER